MLESPVVLLVRTNPARLLWVPGLPVAFAALLGSFGPWALAVGQPQAAIAPVVLALIVAAARAPAGSRQ